MKTRRVLLTASASWRMDRDTAATIAVARSLRHLAHEYPALHLINGLVSERVAEVDHVAVGLTGVFAIETGSQDGEMRSDRQGNFLPDVICQESLQRARRGAAAVRERLRRRGLDVGVQGVLCLPFARLERPEYVNGIIVSRPEPLAYLIRHWPGQQLTPVQSARVLAALQPRVHRAAA